MNFRIHYSYRWYPVLEFLAYAWYFLTLSTDMPKFLIRPFVIVTFERIK